MNGELNENISRFFADLRFTNPRRVKKLLNKYSILRSLKTELHHNHKLGKSIASQYLPDFKLLSEGSGSIFINVNIKQFLNN